MIILQYSGRAFSLLLTLLGKQVLTQPKWRSCGWLMTGLDLAPVTSIPTPHPLCTKISHVWTGGGAAARLKPPSPTVKSCSQSIQGDTHRQSGEMLPFSRLNLWIISPSWSFPLGLSRLRKHSIPVIQPKEKDLPLPHNTRQDTAPTLPTSRLPHPPDIRPFLLCRRGWRT